MKLIGETMPIAPNITLMMEMIYVPYIRCLTRTKMAAMVDEGIWCGGSPPWGHRTEAVGASRAGSKAAQRLAPDEAQTAAVTAAFDMAADGCATVAIRDYLNEMTSRAWTTSAVRRCRIAWKAAECAAYSLLIHWITRRRKSKKLDL